MEVCVDSLESAINAFNGGANRIELCSSLDEGGLTPTIGLYKSIRKSIPIDSDFKIFCMIRPRCGDFLYSDSEIMCMEEDIKQYVELETDGLVFGALTDDGSVDITLMKQLLKLIPSKFPVTFHRAFDMCADWQSSLDAIQKLGFKRILTSGQEKSAYEGRKNIRKFNDHIIKNCLEPLIIMPGAGINSTNLETLLIETLCKEFHASCRNSRSSRMVYQNKNISMGNSNDSEYIIKYTDVAKVTELAQIYKNTISK